MSMYRKGFGDNIEKPKKPIKKKKEKVEMVMQELQSESTPSTEDYYVYAATNGRDVLYVGYGTGARYKHCYSGCSHVYGLNKLHFEGVDIRVDKLHTGLSKDEAKMVELMTIKELSPVYNVVGNKKPLTTSHLVTKLVEEINQDMCNGAMSSSTIRFMWENMKWWLQGVSVSVTRKHEDSFCAAILKPAQYISNFNATFPDALVVERVKGVGLKVKFSEEYLNDLQSRIK